MSDTIESSTPLPAGNAEGDPLGRVVRMGLLIDLYGGLLTERQRTFIQAHYEDDLSFGEVARTHGVSRQAVHDAVKHAEASLEEYESKMRLLERGVVKAPGSTGSAAKPSAAEAKGSDDATADEDVAVPDHVAKAVGKLREIRDRMRRAGGVIYNGDGLAREIEQIASELEQG